MIRFIVLDDAIFDKEYYKAFETVHLETDADKEEFGRTVHRLRDLVVNRLKQGWQEEDDFEVSWDYDYCLHACGGIYSEKAFCREYVEAVAEALASFDPEGRWAYHTVCEILVNPDGRTAAECNDDRGEFFIRGGTCYINGSMSPEHRQRLGCSQ